MIASMEEFSAMLADAQARLASEVRCSFTQELSARVKDASLVESLVIGLPMAQGVQHRIVRSRGRGAVLTVKIRYREGVRMLDHWRNGRRPVLATGAVFVLAKACDIAQEACRLEGEAQRLQHVYTWICQNIRYVHTAPGQKGYERLVGAAGALQGRQANCQGFADVLYLLCGICGIECEYCCERGSRRLHVWNRVWIDGCWQDADASRGAREYKQRKTASL